MSIELIDHINVQNTLGESPVWDERTGHLWWVDIQARLIYRYDLSTKTYENFAVPERACALGLTTDIGTQIIGFETGFALFDYASGVITWLARPEFKIQVAVLMMGGWTGRGGFGLAAWLKMRARQGTQVRLFIVLRMQAQTRAPKP